MYTYIVYDSEDEYSLTHDKKFTQEEFEKMCNEAKAYNMKLGKKDDYVDSYDMEHYLRDHYGFKLLEYTAGFPHNPKPDSWEC